MAVDFPNSPAVDEQFQVNGRTWKWNGSVWVAVGTSTGATGLQGIQGAYGAGVSDGAQGFTGQNGLQGTASGLQGLTGSNGTAGTQGTTGVQGVAGASTKTAFTAGGGFYYAEAGGGVNASIAATEDRTYYMPLFVPATVTFSEIMCRTGATFSGTASVRLGLYNDSGGVPTTVAFDASTVSCTAASTFYPISISQTVNAGTYWLAFNMQTSATTSTFEAGVASVLHSMLGLPMLSSLECPYGYYQNSVTGAFATAGTLVLAAVSFPLVSLKVT